MLLERRYKVEGYCLLVYRRVLCTQVALNDQLFHWYNRISAQRMLGRAFDVVGVGLDVSRRPRLVENIERNYACSV